MREVFRPLALLAELEAREQLADARDRRAAEQLVTQAVVLEARLRGQQRLAERRVHPLQRFLGDHQALPVALLVVNPARRLQAFEREFRFALGQRELT
ncbi:MAG: hypothetical protein IPK27_10000 [Rhodanobacteraceae bacterium]|nr:hypothetical protein [Rhodanobacteraceae bacterium]